MLYLIYDLANFWVHLKILSFGENRVVYSQLRKTCDKKGVTTASFLRGLASEDGGSTT